MQFGFLLTSVVLAALGYTLGTLQTATHFRRKPIQTPAFTQDDQLHLALPPAIVTLDADHRETR